MGTNRWKHEFWSVSVSINLSGIHIWNFLHTVEKIGDFFTSISLSNKSTFLANKISYQKLSEINVKAAKIKILRLSFPLLSEKPLTTSVVWKNFDQKVVSAGKWGMEAGMFWIFFGFHVHFTLLFFYSFSIWNLAFLRNVWAFHFCSMWIVNYNNHCFSLPKSPLPWRYYW
jgi:hypothetical protein